MRHQYSFLDNIAKYCHRHFHDEPKTDWCVTCHKCLENREEKNNLSEKCSVLCSLFE